MKRKRKPLKVIIVNPEVIPIARDRLTLALLELIENKKLREIQEV